MIWNYLLCFLFIACLVIEIYFILRRNRTIIMKGKDDFFTFTLVVLFALVIFPLSDMDSLTANIRNILILVAIFGSAAIKRGFSEKGMEKIFYTVKWEDIQEIHIDAYQTAKIKVVCQTKKGRHKLFFGKYRIKEVLRVLEQHVSNIYIQSSLEETLNMKKCSNC